MWNMSCIAVSARNATAFEMFKLELHKQVFELVSDSSGFQNKVWNHIWHMSAVNSDEAKNITG